MNFFEIIGFCAATLTTVSFLPQAIQVLTTKDTRSISLSMYVIFVSGVFLWFVYGCYLHNLPMIIANIVTMLFASIILFFKVKNLKNEKK